MAEISSLAEAVAEPVRDGDTVALDRNRIGEQLDPDHYLAATDEFIGYALAEWAKGPQ